LNVPEKTQRALPGLEDLFVFGGLVFIGVGLWFVDWRLSCVVVGSLALGLGAALTFWRTR
jgi:hypothetical protein